LPRTSILFRPHRFLRINWWRRRALPPGPLRLFYKTFIAIVGFPTLLI
ncbi:uncharacterized protein METZ01_LOCUS229763, partial [marine metagenome]